MHSASGRITDLNISECGRCIAFLGVGSWPALADAIESESLRKQNWLLARLEMSLEKGSVSLDHSRGTGRILNVYGKRKCRLPRGRIGR